MQRNNHSGDGITYWWWLIAPLGLLLVQLICRYVDQGSGFYFAYIETERGLVENLTAIVLVPAAYFAFTSAHRMNRMGHAVSPLWFLVAGVICVAFFGEEISWGQQWLGWESPSFFAEYNRQGETNVHNLHLHFGRFIKTILTVLIVIGGLILPLLYGRRIRKDETPVSDSDYLWSPVEGVLTAGLVLGVRIVERIKTWFDIDQVMFFDMNLKELQELYLAYFLLLYLWHAHSRIHRASAEDFAVTQQ